MYRHFPDMVSVPKYPLARGLCYIILPPFSKLWNQNDVQDYVRASHLREGILACSQPYIELIRRTLAEIRPRLVIFPPRSFLVNRIQPIAERDTSTNNNSTSSTKNNNNRQNPKGHYHTKFIYIVTYYCAERSDTEWNIKCDEIKRKTPNWVRVDLQKKLCEWDHSKEKARGG